VIFRRRRDAPTDPPFRLHGAPAAAEAPDSGPSGSNPSTAARDLVIGAVSGYGFDDMRYWVNSLARSGFSGERVVIAYAADFDTVDELTDRGHRVVTFAEDGKRRRFFYPVRGFRHEDTSIDRFYQIWRFLQMDPHGYRFVAPVDVRDVIFQRNPSTWLEEHLGDMKINVGSEGVPIADEPWNSEVVLESYGRSVHAHMGRRETYNAGTIAGRYQVMKDLALNVFLCARLNRISYTDQAALNVLLSLEPYRSITRFNRADDDWACQVGATLARPDGPEPRAHEPDVPPPVLDGDQVRTASGSLYCMVHQYDRIADWKARLERRYAD
jgi:hypothetical protein